VFDRTVLALAQQRRAGQDNDQHRQLIGKADDRAEPGLCAVGLNARRMTRSDEGGSLHLLAVARDLVGHHVLDIARPKDACWTAVASALTWNLDIASLSYIRFKAWRNDDDKGVKAVHVPIDIGADHLAAWKYGG
jgi:hypothetical protein